MAGRSASVACIKLLLTVFNVVFWVSGLAILALGIWMKLELYIYMQLTTVYFDSAPYILIAVGCAIVVVGSLGCLCTIKGFPALLYLFSVLLMLIFIVELATAIAIFVYKAKLSDAFKSGLHDAMYNYSNSSQQDKKDAVDGMQSALGCCGSASYEDWYDIDWSGKGLSRSVPLSCCREMPDAAAAAELPAAEQCDNFSTDDIYTEGCYAKLTSFVEKDFLMIGAIAAGFCFLQLFGALLACCLAKNINRAKYEQMA